MTTGPNEVSKPIGAHAEAAEDEALASLLSTVELAPHRLAQIEEASVASLGRGARRTTLAAEWLELLRIRPFSTTALALAGATALVVLSPLGGLLATVLGG